MTVGKSPNPSGLSFPTPVECGIVGGGVVDDTEAPLGSNILYRDLFQGTSGDCCLLLEGKKDADHGDALNRHSTDASGFGWAEQSPHKHTPGAGPVD